LGLFHTGDEMNCYLMSLTTPDKRRAVVANVREKCMPMIAPYPTKIRAVTPPPGVEPNVRDLLTKIDLVRTAWNDYVTALGSDDHSQDEEMAGRVTESWIAYNHSHKALADRLKELSGAGQ